MSGNFSVHGWRFEQRTFWYQFIESQTHFGMPKGAKMSLALNELHEIGCPLFNFKHAPQVEGNDRFCMQEQSMGNNRGPPLTKSSIEFISITLVAFTRRPLLLCPSHAQGG